MAEMCGLWSASGVQPPQGGFVFGWSGEELAAISSSRLYQLARLQNVSSVLQSHQYKSSQKDCWVLGGGGGFGFRFLVCFPIIGSVNLQTNIRSFCCVQPPSFVGRIQVWRVAALIPVFATVTRSQQQSLFRLF